MKASTRGSFCHFLIQKDLGLFVLVPSSSVDRAKGKRKMNEAKAIGTGTQYEQVRDGPMVIHKSRGWESTSVVVGIFS